MWASTAGEGKQLTAWCQLTCGVGQTAVAPRRSRWQSLGSFNSCREARTQSCSFVTPHIFVSSVRPHLGRSSMFCVLLFFNHKIPIHRHSSAWTVERLSCGSAVRHCCGRELQAAGEYPPEASDGLASRPGVPNYDPRPNRAEPSIHNSQAKNYFYIFKQIKKKKRLKLCGSQSLKQLTLSGSLQKKFINCYILTFGLERTLAFWESPLKSW